MAFCEEASPPSMLRFCRQLRNSSKSHYDTSTLVLNRSMLVPGALQAFCAARGIEQSVLRHVRVSLVYSVGDDADGYRCSPRGRTEWRHVSFGVDAIA